MFFAHNSLSCYSKINLGMTNVLQLLIRTWGALTDCIYKCDKLSHNKGLASQYLKKQ